MLKNVSFFLFEIDINISKGTLFNRIELSLIRQTADRNLRWGVYGKGADSRKRTKTGRANVFNTGRRAVPVFVLSRLSGPGGSEDGMLKHCLVDWSPTPPPLPRLVSTVQELRMAAPYDQVLVHGYIFPYTADIKKVTLLDNNFSSVVLMGQTISCVAEAKLEINVCNYARSNVCNYVEVQVTS